MNFKFPKPRKNRTFPLIHVSFFEMSNKKYFVPHHSGSVVTFNLKAVMRLKGSNSKKVQEKWKPAEGLPLTARIKLSEEDGGQYPWIICHRGHVEVFRSAIFSNAVQNNFNGTTVHLGLSSWTNRKDPIVRPFLVTFLTTQEAKSFVFCFNCFLEEYLVMKEKKGEDGSSAERKGDSNDDEEGGGEDGSGEDDGEDGGEEEYDGYGDGIWGLEETQDPFPDYISD